MKPVMEAIKNKEKYMKPPTLTEEKLRYALGEAVKKIDKALDDFHGGFAADASCNYVYSSVENHGGWSQGFWMGILWIAYELTGNEAYRTAAESRLASYSVRIKEKEGVDHHDMGFLYIPSCVAAYKLTGNQEAREAALLAADNLADRYHEKGGFIQAWGSLDSAEYYRFIIDCLLNIPLLYWAAAETHDEKYQQIAYRHYRTTAANILRKDGSTYHTFYMDMETGRPLKGVTHQGAADDSCWARGQAWGMYGFMLTYAYLHNEDAISLTKVVSNYFLNRLPGDFIPYWDLIYTDGAEERDSSAGAIAACGLLECANALKNTEEEKELYQNAAKHIVNSLIDHYLTKDIPASNGLLMHAVYAKPQGLGIDECNIWGDYFYMEALARLIRGTQFHGYWY